MPASTLQVKFLMPLTASMTPAPILDERDGKSSFFDIVVVGGGPAGALAARQAALSGFSVMLVDRAEFPRKKVCGCCLHPRGARVLKRAGLGELMEELSARTMSHVLLGVRGRQHELQLEGVQAVSRGRFDTALVDAAREAGVVVRFGFVAQLQEPAGEKDFRIVDLMRVAKQSESSRFPLVPERPERIQVRCVVAADGLGGALLAGVGETPQEVQPNSRIGVGTRIPSGVHQQRVDRMCMSVGKSGYIASVVLEDGRLDLAGAIDPQAMAHFGVGGVVEQILAEANVEPPPGLDEADWLVTPALTRRAKGLNEHPLGSMRAFAIGDAAGCVEPFTGEGLAWALQSALAVQPLLRRAVENWHDSLGLEWARVHEEEFGERRRACARIAKLARSPRALSMAATVMAHSRQARGLVARAGYGVDRRPAQPSLIPVRRNA